MKNEVWYGIEDITHDILVRDGRDSRPYMRKREGTVKREIDRLCTLNPTNQYRVVWLCIRVKQLK